MIVVPAYLLALAGLLMLLNIHTTRSGVAKRISYFGMWACLIAVPVVLVLLLV